MSPRTETGVCTVHVYPQQSHVVIKVTSTYFSGDGLRPKRTGPEIRSTEIDAVLAAVRDFLDPYVLQPDFNDGSARPPAVPRLVRGSGFTGRPTE
jgi:hypothetical protein